MLDVSMTSDHVAVVAMARPPVNALDLELATALAETFPALAEQGATAAVLTGNGRVFSAGVDLRALTERGPEYVDDFLQALSAAFAAVTDCPLPVVAAIEGPAIAGGCILGCAADLTLVAADRGRVGLTELAVGVPFPPIAMELVRYRTGERAPRLVWTAAVLDAQASVDAGFADAVVDDKALVDTAVSEARRLAAIPPEVFRMTKAQLHAPLRERRGAAADDTGEIHRLWRSEPVRAAVDRFVEENLR